MIEQSDSDIDEDGDLVDQLYSVQNFGTSAADNKKAEDMLKRFQQSEKEMAESEKGLPEEDKCKDEAEVNALEDMMNEANIKADISKTYKLFNWITLQNPQQILRYFSPTLYREKAFVEPMWAS
jgi:hypothetical protein